MPQAHRLVLGRFAEARPRGETRFADTDMPEYLPRKHLSRYNVAFAGRFVVCVLTVAWKLREPALHWLACNAEELALRAVIEEARASADSSNRVTIADGTGSRSMGAFLEPSVRSHRRLFYWDGPTLRALRPVPVVPTITGRTPRVAADWIRTVNAIGWGALGAGPRWSRSARAGRSLTWSKTTTMGGVSDGPR